MAGVLFSADYRYRSSIYASSSKRWSRGHVAVVSLPLLLRIAIPAPLLGVVDSEPSASHERFPTNPSVVDRTSIVHISGHRGVAVDEALLGCCIGFPFGPEKRHPGP